MMKNIVDLGLGVFAWWSLGWAVAYGPNGNWFIGSGQFFNNGNTDLLSFASTTSTIDSGAVAERCAFVPYLIMSAIMTGFTYAVAAHWVWHSDGWLYKRGFYDLAGGAIYLGPRIGRFRPKDGTVLATLRLKLKPPKREASTEESPQERIGEGSIPK
eukprot:gene28933-35946_t